MSQDIADFLRARYAEEKAEAEKLSNENAWGLDPWEISKQAEQNYPCDEFLCIAKARVLADLDAKEQILRELPGLAWHEPCVSLVGLVLALLAVPYAAHPEYEEDWRP